VRPPSLTLTRHVVDRRHLQRRRLGPPCLLLATTASMLSSSLDLDLDLASSRIHDAVGNALTPSPPVLNCRCRVFQAQFYGSVSPVKSFVAAFFHIRWGFFVPCYFFTTICGLALPSCCSSTFIHVTRPNRMEFSASHNALRLGLLRCPSDFIVAWLHFVSKTHWRYSDTEFNLLVKSNKLIYLQMQRSLKLSYYVRTAKQMRTSYLPCGFFFSRLISAVAEWMFAILSHMLRP